MIVRMVLCTWRGVMRAAMADFDARVEPAHINQQRRQDDEFFSRSFLHLLELNNRSDRHGAATLTLIFG